MEFRYAFNNFDAISREAYLSLYQSIRYHQCKMIPIRIDVHPGEIKTLPIEPDATLSIRQISLLYRDNSQTTTAKKSLPNVRVFLRLKPNADDSDEEDSPDVEEYAISVLSYPLNTEQRIDLALNGMDGEFAVRFESSASSKKMKDEHRESFVVQLAGFLTTNNDDEDDSEKDRAVYDCDVEFDESDGDEVVNYASPIFHKMDMDDNGGIIYTYDEQQPKSTVTFEDITDQE